MITRPCDSGIFAVLQRLARFGVTIYQHWHGDRSDDRSRRVPLLRHAALNRQPVRIRTKAPVKFQTTGPSPPRNEFGGGKFA
jgi:hypothetical protein